MNNNHQKRIDKNDDMLKKVDQRDKLSRIILAAAFIGFIVAAWFTILELRAQQAQSTQYIRCVALLKFDLTTEEKASREATAKALDSCATKEQNDGH